MQNKYRLVGIIWFVFVFLMLVGQPNFGFDNSGTTEALGANFVNFILFPGIGLLLVFSGKKEVKNEKDEK